MIGSHSKYDELTGRKKTGGMYSKCIMGPVSVVRGGGQRWDYGLNPQETIFHEYVHYMMYQHGKAYYPKWYSEGFAEYLSTFELKKGKFIIGGVPNVRVPALVKTAKWAPAASILASSTKGSRGRSWGDKDGTSLLYAQSWLTVHLMHSDPVLSRNLSKYLLKIVSGESSTLAFESAFGKPVSYLDIKLMEIKRTRRLSKVTYQWDDWKEIKAQVRKLSQLEGDLKELAVTKQFALYDKKSNKTLKRAIKKIEKLFKTYDSHPMLNAYYAYLKMTSRQTKDVHKRSKYLREKSLKDPVYKEAYALLDMTLLARLWDGGIRLVAYRKRMSEHKPIILKLLKRDNMNIHLRYLYTSILTNSNNSNLRSAEMILLDTHLLYPQNFKININLVKVMAKRGNKKSACKLIYDLYTSSTNKSWKNFVTRTLNGKDATELSCAVLKDREV